MFSCEKTGFSCSLCTSSFARVPFFYKKKGGSLVAYAPVRGRVYLLCAWLYCNYVFLGIVFRYFLCTCSYYYYYVLLREQCLDCSRTIKEKNRRHSVSCMDACMDVCFFSGSMHFFLGSIRACMHGCVNTCVMHTYVHITHTYTNTHACMHTYFYNARTHLSTHMTNLSRTVNTHTHLYKLLNLTVCVQTEVSDATACMCILVHYYGHKYRRICAHQ